MGIEGRQRIEVLYRSVLERDKQERRAYLAEVCEGDEELQRQVQQLLDQRESAGPGEAATDLFSETSSERFGDRAPSRSNHGSIPDRFSHYKIVRKLGEGGMGIVYEARDERLGRPVAIKTIRAAGDSHEARARFWQEARSLARVNHPRVCQIFDVDEEQGILFLVLELLEGRSLEDRLKAEATPLDEAVGIAHEILEALQALHGFNIVHRDLKPSNVFLTPRGVKLLDFGLARQLEPSFAGDAVDTPTATLLTTPGTILGTPHYMAPEQVDGKAVGPAADLFAAGCLLYEMIAGRRAFRGNSPIDVLYQVKHSEPPQLVGSPAISAVAAVIRRSMEKRPQDRYQSAQEMADALRSVDVPAGLTSEPQRRKVIRFIALPFRSLRRDDDTDFLAYSLPDAVSNSLSGIDSVIVRSSLMGARLDMADLKTVAIEADVDVVLTGTLLRAGEKLRVSSQLVEVVTGNLVWSDTSSFSLADIFQLQDDLTNRIVESLMLPLTARERRSLHCDVPANAQAYQYYLQANQLMMNRTSDNVKAARDLYLRCVQDDPTYAPAWARLGRAYRLVEKFGEASEENFQLADAAYRRAFALNPDLPVAHNHYTSIECDLGRAPDAMVRLLGRAKHKHNDPELFAGLVQACRYSGELRASIGANEQATHLDPHFSTSISHTHFLLCDYQKALESIPPGGGFYLDAAALVSLGREAEALSRLCERENLKVGGPHSLMRSLRALLDGDSAGAIRVIEASDMRDPESLFYMARHLAHIKEEDRAIAMLFRTIEQNFICEFSLTHDPWFDPLRSQARYTELLQTAAQCRRQAHTAFVEAGGELLLETG